MSIDMSPGFQQDWNFSGNPNDSDLVLMQGGTLFSGDRGIDRSVTPFVYYICTNEGSFNGIDTITGSVWKQIIVSA